MKYLFNYLRSFVYDLRFHFLVDVKRRASLDNYEAYVTNKMYPGYLKHGNAMVHIKDYALNWCKGMGLDIGAGIWAFPGARAVENDAEESAYHLLAEDNSLDFIFSSHLLEHLEEPEKAVREWKKKLRPGGVVFLYQPHPTCQMWQPKNLKYHVWLPGPKEVTSLFESCGLSCEEASLIPDIYFSYHMVFKKPDDSKI